MLTPVETVAQAVLIDHRLRSVETCICGWGHEPEHVGRSHAEHVIDRLRAAGLRIVGAPR